MRILGEGQELKKKKPRSFPGKDGKDIKEGAPRELQITGTLLHIGGPSHEAPPIEEPRGRPRSRGTSEKAPLRPLAPRLQKRSVQPAE